jgi:glutathione S-transferase
MLAARAASSPTRVVAASRRQSPTRLFAASSTEAPPVAAAGAQAAADYVAPLFAALDQSPTPGPALSDAGPPPAKFQPGKGTLLAVGAAAFAPVARLGSGALAYGYKVERGDSAAPGNAGRYAVVPGVFETSLVSTLPRPAKPIVLFEFQSCPFCAKVREAASFLDLDVLFLPCPKGGARFRPQAERLGGKQQFPLMLDVSAPGGPVMMYESNDIIRYLFDRYGPGVDAIPGPLQAGTFSTVSAGLALLPRGGAGGRAAETNASRAGPPKPLVLWAYEASPFVRLVRERLGELELPHLQVTCARGSADKRQRLLDARGAFQVPYLEDPNTGSFLFESAAILSYLDETYGRAGGRAGRGQAGGSKAGVTAAS